MRSPLITIWLYVRLLWGGIFSPVVIYSQKFFPPPRRVSYKKGLADYFFQN
jgi:hypothetical protein